MKNLTFLISVLMGTIAHAQSTYLPKLEHLYRNSCPEEATIKIETPDRSRMSIEEKRDYVYEASKGLVWIGGVDRSNVKFENGFYKVISLPWNVLIFNENADLVQATIDEDMYIPTYYSCLSGSKDASVTPYLGEYEILSVWKSERTTLEFNKEDILKISNQEKAASVSVTEKSSGKNKIEFQMSEFSITGEGRYSIANFEVQKDGFAWSWSSDANNRIFKINESTNGIYYVYVQMDGQWSSHYDFVFTVRKSKD